MSVHSEMTLPPTSESDRLARELRLVKRHDREDAFQEAWLAHLEARDAARAVNTFAARERRHRKRQTEGILTYA
jgi:hypothetical protein